MGSHQPQQSQPAQPEEAVLSLMRTLCEEMHLLACEIVQLGETLSEEYAEQPTMRMRDLQSFDMISQNAVAQARLLKGVERRLSGLTTPGDPDITALIEAVPFLDVRRRLLASFHGPDAVGASPASAPAGDADWLF